MGSLVTDPDAFQRLFEDFQHASFKLEVRRSYGLASEDEPFQKFLAGEDPGIEWLRSWLDLMEAETSKGKRVERVRVVDEPPSDYLRFEVSVAPHNVAAGEDIRYLERDRATDLALPEHSPVENDFSGHSAAVVQAGLIQGNVNLRTVTDVPLPSPRQLPPATKGFVDREVHIQQLDWLLDEVELITDEAKLPVVTISTISGSAGVGKTKS